LHDGDKDDVLKAVMKKKRNGGGGGGGGGPRCPGHYSARSTFSALQKFVTRICYCERKIVPFLTVNSANDTFYITENCLLNSFI
jgi:hypothetical protein